MKLIKPITMTDAQISASNIAETDAPEWSAGTTYAQGDNVILLSTHKLYESQINSNLGNDPATDDGTNWLEISATNRWKAFDGKLADQVSNSGSITYEIVPATKVSGIAFFNSEAAEIRVQISDESAVLVYDSTQQLVDDSDIIDWYTAFTTELDGFDREALFGNLPALPNYQINITIGDGAGDVKVGEIALGNMVQLGITLEGTSLGLTSFSTKEQDDFGNWTIVNRAKSDPVDFIFAMNAGDAGRVRRVLSSLRDTPAVYFAHEELTSYGAVVYGFFQDYDIPLRHHGVSIVNLEIEGLT